MLTAGSAHEVATPFFKRTFRLGKRSVSYKTASIALAIFVFIGLLGELEAVPEESTAAVTVTSTPAVGQSNEASVPPSTPSPSATPSVVVETSAGAGQLVLPPDQEKFLQAIADAQEVYDSAETDLQQSNALRERDEALCRILDSRRFNDWMGVVSDIGANGEGKAYVDIEIDDGVRFGTWSNAFSDIMHNTLIDRQSRNFEVLLGLAPGDTVRFSGRLFDGDDTCLYGKNITETFYMIDPQFLMRLERIEAISR